MAVDGKNLYVGNVSYNSTEEDLRHMFGRFGDLTKVLLPTDRETGRSRGFAFVEFTREDNAQSAIENLDGADLDGRQLKVSVAKPKNTDGGGGGGGGRYEGGGGGGGYGGGGGGYYGGGGQGGGGGGGRRY